MWAKSSSSRSRTTESGTPHGPPLPARVAPYHPLWRFSMRRFSLPLMFAILPALTLGLLLTGCSGKKGDDEDDAAPRSSKKSNRSKGGPTTASESLKPVKATEYTKITGMVTWNGDL